jgi:hypothetical protein
MIADNSEIITETNIKVSFTPVHKLAIKSQLRIAFAQEFSITGTNCALSSRVGISASATCAYSGKTVVVSNPFAAEYDPAVTGQISFKMNGITMPVTSAATSIFSIETTLVSLSDGLGYLVDKVSVSNLLQATHGKMNGATIASSVTITNNLSVYTVTFKPAHNIVKSGKI